MTAILILALLIVLNGLFAMAETAVVSSRKSRLKQRAQEGSKRARVAYKLAKNPNRFLATIQIGITMIGILSGALAEERLAADLQAWLGEIPIIEKYRDPLATGLLVGALTYFSLVIGELIPKRIALMYPEAIASSIGLPMRGLSRLTAPLVYLLSFSTDLVLRIFGVRAPKEEPVTPEELKVLIQEGASAGIFDQTEQDIVTNVFRLAERRASAIMTPRTEIMSLDVNDSPESIRAKILEEPHAFYPVVENHMDHVMGVLSAKDIMTQVLGGEEIQLTMLMHRPLIVPESISILQMLDSFRINPAQVAFIADEYGSILGLVTQNSVVEAIVGEMPDLEEPTEPDMVIRDDGTYLVNGAMAADDLREKLRLPELPGRNHYDTVGGFALLQLQRIPSVGDSFEWGGAIFEVVDMDGKRIDKILVTLPKMLVKVDDQDD
jgi:putative hemolysin